MSREIYFCDSFSDRSYNNQSGWKYSVVGFTGQGAMKQELYPAPIPAGFGLQFTNTGFHSTNFTKVLSGRSRWVAGFGFRPIGIGIGDSPESIFFRIEDGGATDIPNGENPNTQLSVLLDADSKLRFYSAGKGGNSHPGNLLYVSTMQFDPANRVYLEIDVTFGTSGEIHVYVDDVLLFEQLNVNIGQGSTVPRQPDRFTLKLEHFGTEGVRFTDLYIANERLGPVRVSPWFFTAQAAAEHWIPKTPGLNVDQVKDHPIVISGNIANDTPDGDVTYIESSNPGDRDVYLPGPIACFGLNLAVAVNICARLTAGSPSLQAVLLQGATETSVGASQPAAANYGILQGMIQLSPRTGVEFTDLELQTSGWGATLSGSGTARITAIWIEKVTSLRAVPYSCGVGSYVY